MRFGGTHDTMASREVLLNWCSQTCATYPRVEITDLSSSFRDGLAFCAIIHKHRPDLIDFKSLCRGNVYENNQLAFEVAETKLGIPAFLVPKEMLATEVPDHLSVITYLSQYYHYFSGLSSAGPSSSRSSHINLPHKQLATLPAGENNHCVDTSLLNVCHICIKPVHLIQRYVIRGEIWHRSCFKCSVCHCTLAAGFYTPGKDAGCFVCSDHITDGPKNPSDEKFELCEDCTSLDGLKLIGVTQCSEEIKSRDGPVYEPVAREQTAQNESSDTQRNMSKPPSPQLVPVSAVETSDGKEELLSVVAGNCEQKEEANTEEPSESSSPWIQATGGGKQLEPEQMSVSVSGPENHPSHTLSSTSGSSSVESQSSAFSSRITTKHPVKSNHPWLGIIHPGPWTQLPPVQSPGPPMHSKRGPNGQFYWYRPRVPPPNPFGEDLDEEDGVKTEPHLKHTHVGVSRQHSCSDLGKNSALPTTSDVQERVNSSTVLSRSLSVPAVKSAKVPFDITEDNKPLSSSQMKQVCKEKDHFDAKTEMPKSSTCQALTSGRTPAPGHGFPLIKRKVRADKYAPSSDPKVETRQVKKQLEALEERGVELEINLRQCKNDKEEEHLVNEWLDLTHERQFLIRRDTELVYLTKQQKLEEKQADVEYELRRLLNKPESVWSQEDRGREQCLMAELLVIIEQRNQIVSILDQDRKREREEDAILGEMTKNQEIQKEGVKELKKSKGKFKPSKVFKKLNKKGERTKDPLDKKS
ncbi:MICAL-like protein 1 isoform X3 [Syngnathoides biaculeatus]|uniref:MICAL-like protein 1 isoform X3 n=1 Tax=Syngnathoides biaculeatus TaxID=300417 RepID=UPI002ADE13A3|nr:MICAL-like protein 1 isoform X3 [Syngnathoides biaculeatus]